MGIFGRPMENLAADFADIRRFGNLNANLLGTPGIRDYSCGFSGQSGLSRVIILANVAVGFSSLRSDVKDPPTTVAITLPCICFPSKRRIL